MSKRIFDMRPAPSDSFRFMSGDWEWPKIQLGSSKLKSAEDLVHQGASRFNNDTEIARLNEIIREKDAEIAKLRRQLVR